MNYLILFTGLVLVGCSTPTETKEVTETIQEVPNNSYIQTDDNSTIAIPNGSSTSVISTGDNEYFVYCPDGDCSISMITDSQNTETNTLVENNESNSSLL